MWFWKLGRQQKTGRSRRVVHVAWEAGASGLWQRVNDLVLAEVLLGRMGPDRFGQAAFSSLHHRHAEDLANHVQRPCLAWGKWTTSTDLAALLSVWLT